MGEWGCRHAPCCSCPADFSWIRMVKVPCSRVTHQCWLRCEAWSVFWRTLNQQNERQSRSTLQRLSGCFVWPRLKSDQPAFSWWHRAAFLISVQECRVWLHCSFKNNNNMCEWWQSFSGKHCVPVCEGLIKRGVCVFQLWYLAHFGRLEPPTPFCQPLNRAQSECPTISLFEAHWSLCQSTSL